MYGNAPSTLAAMNAESDSYIGQIQLQDILGIGQEGDYLACEQEYGGMPVPLGQLAEMEMGAMGSMPMAPPPGPPMTDPMENETARREMQDLLLQRAQQRESKSADFQQKAAAMMQMAQQTPGY